MDIFKAARNGHIGRIKELLRQGVDINLQDSYGDTALMLASYYNKTYSSLNTVKLLLDEGADINIQDNNGWTALMCASRYSNTFSSLDSIKLLLDRGADINMQNNIGTTALMYAAGESNNDSSLDAVKLLLDRGADINVKNYAGYTALMHASKLSGEESSIDTVKLLLDYGANPFLLNNYKQSALDLCSDEVCKEFLAEFIWKKLYKRDLDTAKIYARETVLPKDIWELILLNKRQMQLCKDLKSNKNKELLTLFAKELKIPIHEDVTKGELCGIISRQLAYGKYYSEESKKYTDEKLRKNIRQIKSIAKSFGLDTNKPIEETIKDLSYLIKE